MSIKIFLKFHHKSFLFNEEWFLKDCCCCYISIIFPVKNYRAYEMKFTNYINTVFPFLML